MDSILLWNDVALEANRVSHTNGQGEQAGPPLSARALALVHLAMYDAYAGCVNDPSLPLYYQDLKRPPKNTPADVAVAVAAQRTLSWLFPSQHATFDTLLTAITDDPKSDAYKFGLAVFETIMEDRKDDPGVGSAGYKPPTGRGKHRVDPDNLDQGFHAPDYGRKSKGIGITQHFELAAPPFDNAEYLAALKQVRGMGIKPELAGTLPKGIAYRMPDDTITGLFWGYDGAAQLGTPPRLYNQIIRAVANTQKNSPAANARLFALVNVAMADAGILAWDQKYIHEFWRPVLAIREHDLSQGPEAQPGAHISADGDPLWLPFGAPKSNSLGKNFTPPFPAYPSGHATFGAAAFQVVRLFYGKGGTFKGKDLTPDKLFAGLDFISEELNGVTRDNTGTVRPKHRRQFPGGLWQMIEENGLSRVDLGVHWIFDAFALAKNGKPDLYRMVKKKPIGGVPLGLQIAEDVFGKDGVPTKSDVGPRTEPVASLHRRSATQASSYLR